jgi:ribosomal protein L37E
MIYAVPNNPPSDNEEPESQENPGIQIKMCGYGEGKHARKIQNARKQWLQGALAMKTLVVGVHRGAHFGTAGNRRIRPFPWDEKKIPVQEGV